MAEQTPDVQEVLFQPKQVIYPMADVSVQATDVGRAVVFEVPGEVLVFPMTHAVAEAVGKKLAAPHVHVPTPGPQGGLQL